MKNIITILFLAVLVTAPLGAQDQSGSVAIADSVVPATENTVSDFTGCVEKLVGLSVPQVKAINACKDASKIAAREKTRGWNESADATKASRPVVVPYYGYGYRYRSRSYYYAADRAARGAQLAQARAERSDALAQERATRSAELAQARAERR